MRLLLINPFDRTITRHYYDLDGVREIAIINYFVQSDELMVFGLGQEHAIWLDNSWALRDKQEFWTLKAIPQGILGGRAVICGRGPDANDPHDIRNCSLPIEGVLPQFDWVPRQSGEHHFMVKELRKNHLGDGPLLPRKVIMRGIPTAQ